MSWLSLHRNRSYTKDTRDLKAFRAGFGLVELMVSISIIIIVLTIILARQDAFNSAVLLRNQTYEVALVIREVQLSAVSVSSDTNLGAFREVLGLHFTTDSSNYAIFRDSGNKYYQANEAYGQQGKLDSRFEVSDVRYGATSVNQLSVIFERPNFDARFFTAANTEQPVGLVQIDIARVGTAGSAGTCGSEFRTIEISRAGQVTVKECP
jgi:type II secretory pathway pseudopilin PulG